MILRVGLTGGIASGKSTVRALFAAYGAYAIDADALVAHLYEPDRAGHRALVAAYGDQILRADRTIDRARLADIAFADATSAKQLNALIHPIVVAHTEELLGEYERTHDDGVVVVEATLMIESGGRARYDRIVIVDVTPEVQIERGIARGLAREEVLRRIANQLPREERLRHADYVIDNSDGIEPLKVEVRRVYDALLADLARKKTNAPQ
ncbi:MAG TPA: dephospho-CoA kinase [Thermoanaerobaculia bacterium]|nr:dephospho-CoA kinase [Thermoanaerobaculia bacterium]